MGEDVNDISQRYLREGTGLVHMLEKCDVS